MNDDDLRQAVQIAEAVARAAARNCAHGSRAKTPWGVGGKFDDITALVVKLD